MPAVSIDLPTSQDPGGVQRGPPPALYDPAGLRSPGAEYPLQPQTDGSFRACQVLHNTAWGALPALNVFIPLVLMSNPQFLFMIKFCQRLIEEIFLKKQVLNLNQ